MGRIALQGWGLQDVNQGGVRARRRVLNDVRAHVAYQEFRSKEIVQGPHRKNPLALLDVDSTSQEIGWLAPILVIETLCG